MNILTKQLLQISFVDTALIVEKAPLSTYEVKGIHQVVATQMSAGG